MMHVLLMECLSRAGYCPVPVVRKVLNPPSNSEWQVLLSFYRESARGSQKMSLPKPHSHVELGGALRPSPSDLKAGVSYSPPYGPAVSKLRLSPVISSVASPVILSL